MSATVFSSSQYHGDHTPERGGERFARNLAGTFNMIGLMLAGAWPATQVIRSRPLAGDGAPG